MQSAEITFLEKKINKKKKTKIGGISKDNDIPHHKRDTNNLSSPQKETRAVIPEKF